MTTLREPWVLAATAAETTAEARARLRELARDGVVLLVTCHRVELYGLGTPPDLGAPIQLHGELAVERLFRVSAGLESAVIGEDEVLHQVRQALAEARARGSLDTRLGRLWEEAIATGRRVRAGRRAPKTGLASRAVAWLAGQTNLSQERVLVAGSGTMGRALVRSLSHAGAKVVVASRDGSRADLDLTAGAAIASEMAGIGVALAGPWEALAEVSTPLPPLADLSFPPAVPSSVSARLGERFLGIDQLFEQAPVEAAWLEQAEHAVRKGVATYLAWLRGRQARKLVPL
jgi:glutamyl-tRNA reductase